MRAYFVGIAIFCLACLGTILLPSLFGFSENILMPLFLVVFVLYWGAGTAVVSGGTIIALVSELWLGIHTGVLALSFLFMVLCLMAVDRFVQVRPLAVSDSFSAGPAAGTVALSAGLYGVLSFSFVAAERLLYRVPASQAKLAFLAHPVSGLVNLAVSALMLSIMFVFAGRLFGVRQAGRSTI